MLPQSTRVWWLRWRGGGGAAWWPAAGGSAAKCRKRRAPSRSLRCARSISRSRRREHVFICMFYPSAALNPTHPDRKVRSAARRARAPSPPLSPPLTPAARLTRETLSEVDGRGRTRVLIATASGHRKRAASVSSSPTRHESQHSRAPRRTCARTSSTRREARAKAKFKTKLQKNHKASSSAVKVRGTCVRRSSKYAVRKKCRRQWN